MKRGSKARQIKETDKTKQKKTLKIKQNLKKWEEYKKKKLKLPFPQIFNFFFVKN
jgi:hypothetical protein